MLLEIVEIKTTESVHALDVTICCRLIVVCYCSIEVLLDHVVASKLVVLTALEESFSL